MNIAKLCFFYPLLFSVVTLVSCNEPDTSPFMPVIESGVQKNVILRGEKWKDGDGYVYCSGEGDNFNNMIYSSFYIFDADFHIRMSISFDTIGETTSIFWFFNNHFGFDSDDKGSGTKERLFMYTPKHDSLLYFQPSKDIFTPGKPFQFEVIRKGDEISFLIDQQLITTQHKNFFSEPLKGTIGIRPWRNRIRIYDWEIKGKVEPLPDIDFVFKNGEDGYACYRIPSVVQTKDGSILAFAEGRVNSCRDNFDVDLVMKKSIDNGKSWGPVQVIWDDSIHTCAYPVPIVDQETGRVILLSVWSRNADTWQMIFKGEGEDTRRIFLFTSNDNGDSWSEKKEITDQVKRPGWDYYGIGGGSGMQMKSEQYENRMLAPAYFSIYENEKTIFRSHLIYSDDGGLNWTIGGISPETGTSECEVAEINNGGLMLNMTKRSKKVYPRSVAVSKDGGLTLQDQRLDDELYGPTCQASLDSYQDESGNFVLLFSNPNHKHAREDVTIQRSTDDGTNWKKIQKVFNGYSGYSDLLIMRDGQIGCLFECGKIWSRDGIAFRSFDLK